jgi:hypothetical protein
MIEIYELLSLDCQKDGELVIPYTYFYDPENQPNDKKVIITRSNDDCDYVVDKNNWQLDPYFDPKKHGSKLFPEEAYPGLYFTTKELMLEFKKVAFIQRIILEYEDRLALAKSFHFKEEA